MASFARFDGLTTNYLPWKMQFENWMSTVNTKGLPLLEFVEKRPTVITTDTLRNTKWFMGLTGDNPLQLSNVLWTALSATIAESDLPQMEALAGTKEHNGFEVYRKLLFCHGRSCVKHRVRGLKQLKNYPRCEKIEHLERELLNWKLLPQK